VFVVTEWLGDMHPHAPWARILTVDELRALNEAGVEIGGHTVTHPDLTALSLEQATSELADCRRALEDLLDAAVTVGSYPFDRANSSTLEACRIAGYASACRGPEGSWKDPLALPRQHMHYDAGVLGLRLKRSARYEPLMEHLPPAKVARRIIRRGRRTIRVVTGDRL
jgi:peptidoglycan/xylan/chitin deacetylase (PgdA/CDA1 family)